MSDTLIPNTVEAEAEDAIRLIISIMDDPDVPLNHEDTQRTLEFIGLLVEVRDGEYSPHVEY